MFTKNGYIVISTIDREERAKEIAKKIVEERLAGCVTILPNATSSYYWENKIETALEFVLLFKTTRKKIKKLIEAIKQIHSYTVPEIAVIKTKFEKPYLNWLKDYVDKD